MLGKRSGLRLLRTIAISIIIIAILSSGLYYLVFIHVENNLDKLVNNTQSGTIKLWHLKSQDWKDKITAFNSKYPNLKIEEKEIESLEEYEKLLSTNNNEAQVISLPSPLWARYYDKAIGAPSNIIKHKTLLKYVDQRISRELIGTNTVKGLMPSTSALLLVSNKDLLKQYNISENNTTWESVLNTCYIFSKQNGAKLTPGCIGLGGANVLNSRDILLNLMLVNGGNINLSNEINFENNKDAVINSIDFYSSFADVKKRNRSFSRDSSSDIEQFNQGNIAMVIIRPSQVKLLNIKNLAYQVMPATNENFKEQFISGDILASLGGDNFNNWTFIKYMNSKSALTLNDDGMLPTRIDLNPNKDSNIFKPLTTKIYESKIYYSFWYSNSPSKVLGAIDQLLIDLNKDKQEIFNNLVNQLKQ